jgi:2-dehydropantoate 2-reductase
MATLIGGRLARSGRASVTLAGTWPAALDAMTRRGIVVEEGRGRFSAPVAVRPVAAPQRPSDLVLVLVKSRQTAGVAALAARAVASNGLVLTLQNGLGNREILEAKAPGQVIAGVATLGATLLGPGHVRAFPGRIVLGAGRSQLLRIGRVAALLRIAGLDAVVDLDIERLVWRKLAVNCAINPLTALLERPNGALLESTDARVVVRATVREVAAVAAARGLALGDVLGLALAVARQTAANRSSMLQDLRRSAATEIDALNGAVVREGRRLGVSTPVNDLLWEAILRREAARPIPVLRARGA